MVRSLVGDKAFYKRVYAIMLPLMIQTLVTNSVNMLDNIMVGQVGTEAMNAVSIGSQLFTLYSFLVFGANAGAGIFSAQFVGAGNNEGVRYTFRYKMYISMGMAVVVASLFAFCGGPLASMYLQGDGDPAMAQRTLEEATKYLAILAVGLLPYAGSCAYSGILRETGKATVPMVASISAVLTNLVGNYVLIFGNFGAPALGVMGAAISTAASRFVEFGIMAFWTHLNLDKNEFARGAYRSFYIPKQLLLQISAKGMPLLCNEFLFSSAAAVINQSYSTCGLDVLAAMTIATTVQGLALVSYAGIGSATGIILGQEIGAGKEKAEVMATNVKLHAMAAGLAAAAGVVLASVAGLFPLMYNTSDAIRSLATKLILVEALSLPFGAFGMAAYFCIRSGGKVLRTVLYDGGSKWIFGAALVFILSRFTAITIMPLYIIGQFVYNVCRDVVAVMMMRKGDWIQNLVKQ